MKRISVPAEDMLEALITLNVSRNQAEDIVSLFEVVDAGRFDVLAMPAMSLNKNNQLPREHVFTTLFAFWQCVYNDANCLDHELQALGAIRSVYFAALNATVNSRFCLPACISVWWTETVELHGSEALELWS